MKLLINRWTSHRIAGIITLVFFAGMMTAVIFMHTEPAAYDDPDADYLACKACGMFPVMLGIILPGIFTSAEMNGNRFIRAIPAAERLFRRDVPLFSAGVGLVWGLLANIVYAVFILASGKDICNISDMLLISALFVTVCMIELSAALSSSIGVSLMICPYLPFIGVMPALSNLPEKIKYEGFGLPVWASGLIFAGGIVLGTAISAVIADSCWKKGNFREQQTAAIYQYKNN